MSLADEVLADLLKRGERARLRGSERAIQMAFKLDSPYWSNYAERQHCDLRLDALRTRGRLEILVPAHAGTDG